MRSKWDTDRKEMGGKDKVDRPFRLGLPFKKDRLESERWRENSIPTTPMTNQHGGWDR